MPAMPTRTRKTAEPVFEPVIEPVIEPEAPAIEEDTVTFKRSHFYAVLTVLAFAAGILVGYVAWGMESVGSLAQGAQVAAQASIPTERPQYVRYDIPTEGSYAIGPEDAPITVVEFSDYQCPFCRRWHDEVYQFRDLRPDARILLRVPEAQLDLDAPGATRPEFGFPLSW